MRKAMLLYNPLSGRRRERRLADVEAALSALRSAGIEASAAATRAASDATAQTKEAIAEGCDTIFACGGDGTVHDVLQGLVGTHTALGIIPLGTANSLAHDLRLPLSPAGAAQAARTAKPRRIAVGKIEYQDFAGNRSQRYFTVTVGIGVDAHLFYGLDPLIKRRFGMAAYCARSRLASWLTHKMGNFAVEFDDCRGVACNVSVPATNPSSGSFAAAGGPHPQSSAESCASSDPAPRSNGTTFVSSSSRPAAAWPYLRYVLRGLFGTNWNVPGIELVHSTAAAVCRDMAPSTDSPALPRVFVEADGELLGTLPAGNLDGSRCRDMTADARALVCPRTPPIGKDFSPRRHRKNVRDSVCRLSDSVSLW